MTTVRKYICDACGFTCEDEGEFISMMSFRDYSGKHHSLRNGSDFHFCNCECFNRYLYEKDHSDVE